MKPCDWNSIFPKRSAGPPGTHSHARFTAVARQSQYSIGGWERSGATSLPPPLVAILRDARKSALLRMRFHQSDEAPSRGGAGLHELVDDRIHQRLERGVDDVGRHPDGGPAFAAFVTALDQDARHRLGAGIEDTHAVVGEFQAADVALVLAEVLAQGEIERVDGAVAFGRGYQPVVADRHLDHSEAHADALAHGVDALFHIDVELGDIEILRHPAEHASRQQLEGGIGRLVGIAHRLAFLDDIEQPGDARIVLVDRNADAVEFREYVGAPRLVRYQELAPVADRLRSYMFVGRGVLHDGRRVDARLGRKRALAHIGRVAVGRAVED